VSNVSQQGQTGGRPPSAVINTNNPPDASVSEFTLPSDNAQTMLVGCALSAEGFTGQLVLASANSDLAAAQVIGIALTTNVPNFTIPDVTYQYNGIVELTAAEWNAVGAGSTGLKPGVPYYVSDVTPGNITDVAPSTGGHFITQLGWAVSPTQLQLGIQYPQPA
jgi:hypothetical protein